MSACSVLLQNSSKDFTLEVSKCEEEGSLEIDDKNVESTDRDADHDGGKKKRITYTKEELLELRSAPASLRRPDCFCEEFFKNGPWDIESWHKSSSSRSQSPAVDGKSVTFDSGKKIELLDKAIELAPHRRSFSHGCHVQSMSEKDSKERESQMRRLGGKGGLGNDSKQSSYEGKDRLTARASLRRRTIEKAVLRENSSDLEHHDIKRLSKSSFDEDVERELRILGDRKHRGRDSDKENRGDIRNTKKDKAGKRRTDSYDSLPEWMTDGPSSQLETIELKGFNKEIEEERSAMRNEAKQRIGSKMQTQTRKSSRGSSRSSTPNDKKEDALYKSDGKVEEDLQYKVKEEKTENYRKNSPTDKIFEENAYFDVLDCLPPHLFADDYVNETTSQSRFSQWFRSGSANSDDGGRPSSVPLSFEAHSLQGYSLNSPTVPLQQYFTPIQPAPSTHQYGDPIAVSPLMELFPKRKSPVSETSKEVKGRMTLKDIEPQIPKPVGQKPDSVAASQDSAKNDHTAFDKLVSSMKAAGQLPEKPAPVVSGLPEHLLPKPPKRTSPSFEKLKRAISRSPSPVMVGRMSPLDFANRSVSPLIAPIGERLLTPEFFKQPHHHTSVSPASFFGGYQDGAERLKGSQMPDRYHEESYERRSLPNQRYESSSINEGFVPSEVHRDSKQQGNAKIPTAFLPTSVIKKMHTEKQDVKDRIDMVGDALAAKLHFGQTDSKSLFDASNTSLDITKPPLQEHDSKIKSDDFGDSVEENFESRSFFEGLLNGKVNSTTDGLDRSNDLLSYRSESQNALHANDLDTQTRLGRSAHASGPLQREFSPTGINPTQNTNRVAISGSLFSGRHNDLETGQKNMIDVNPEKLIAPESQDKLNVNRQPVFSGLVGSTVGSRSSDGRIVNRDIGTRGSIMQPKVPFSQLPNGHQNHQQNLVRSVPLRQRPVPQQAQMNPFPHARNIQPNNPRLPVPMNSHLSLNNNMPFYRASYPAATAAVAAQIMHQQLVNQAARAHLHAAHMLQQQQLRTQMQAAMFQAYARGQAAKAMMSNPRTVANNIQAVAQQIGIKAPQPPGHVNAKSFPTSLMSQPSAMEIRESTDAAESSLQESPLSKWFNVDAIQKTPPAPTKDPAAKGKVFTVEDLERSQR